MRSLCKRSLLSAGTCLSVLFAAQAYGHGEGGVNSKNLVRVALVPNPSVPEYADARGTVAVDLSKGIIQLKKLTGFPIDPSKNLPLTITVTSLTDPRLKGHGGELGTTSCEPASDNEAEQIGPWHCHVHSYVVWLVGLEDGELGHALPLGTIYPRTDGTAADRDFSAQQGNLSALGADTIIITAEVSFGPLPSIAHGHDGETEVTLVPRGPIVLQATIP